MLWKSQVWIELANNNNKDSHYLHFDNEIRFIKPPNYCLRQGISYNHPLFFMYIIAYALRGVQSVCWHSDLSSCCKGRDSVCLNLNQQHHLTGFKLLSKAYFKCRCFAGQRVIIPIIQMTQRRPFHISWPFCFVAVPNASVHFSSSATQRAWFCFPSPCSRFFLYRRGLRSLFCKLIYSNHGPGD